MIDKAALFGRYQSHEDKLNALGLKAAHKALDLPQDDMTITTTTNHNYPPQPAAAPPSPAPPSMLGKVLLASAIGLGAGVLGGLGLKALMAPPPVPVQTPPTAEPFDPTQWKLRILP